jgi:hypothetical protein
MWKRLKQNKELLTKQQYRTIKGQLIAGDIEGATKGLNRLLRKKGGT